MTKRVILVTGTPCVGKTSVARLLASNLNALYLNLTELALTENLVSGKDKERGSVIVDEDKMQNRIGEIIADSKEDNIVVDGHYAVSVVPINLITCVFVLRRDPVELREFMERSGFSGKKLYENLASEILDVCMVDALNLIDQRRVCEVDVTGKTVDHIVQEVLRLLNDPDSCRVGTVDWLGKLEKEGLLEEYLRI
jgi:adenylate kinase